MTHRRGEVLVGFAGLNSRQRLALRARLAVWDSVGNTMPIKATDWKCRVTDISASTDRLLCGVGFKSWCSGIQKEAIRMLLNICIPLGLFGGEKILNFIV